jgi:hypothetical protein
VGTVIDMSNVSTAPVLLPDAKFPATIVKAKAGKSQAGNPKIDLQWKTQDDDRLDPTHRGVRVFDTLTFTPESLWRVKLVLDAINMGDITVDTDELVELAAELLEAEACITVGQEPGRGVDDSGNPRPPRNKVVKVEHIDAFEPAGFDEEDETDDD